MAPETFHLLIGTSIAYRMLPQPGRQWTPQLMIVKDPATEDGGSSSDNETTYFIPLQTSGQSFGVAVKLGTDASREFRIIFRRKLLF